MKKILPAIIIIFACFAVGYGIGTLIGREIKKRKVESHYIGAAEPQIENGIMTPEVMLSLGRLSDPRLSPDGRSILFGVTYTSIIENRTCRNLFVCNADGSSRRQLTRFGKSVSNARWSPDGNSIWFIQDGQIWNAPLKEDRLGKKIRMSDIPSGVNGFEISPDGNSIIYSSVIKNPALVQPADTDPLLDKASAYSTEDLMYRHWDHWVTEIPRTYVSTLCNGEITPDNSYDILGNGNFYELPSEPFGGMEQLSWAPDNRHIAFSCRMHTGKEYAFSTDTDIFVHDILTGENVQISFGGGYDNSPVWSPDGKSLAWISMARDGYESDRQRLMICDFAASYAPAQDGQESGLSERNSRELAASLDRDADGIFWTPDSKNIIFQALTDGKQALFSVDVHTDETIRLTSENWKFDFSSPFGITKNGTLLASYCCMNFPTELVAVYPPENSFKQITDENAHIFNRLADCRSESVEVETIDGKQMQCWVLYPPHFDDSKVYPAIEIVLGGPQGTCSQDWSYRWCYRLMAEQGYVVLLPNRRGTTAFGQEWKEQISGDYCGLNMQDYLSAGRWLKSKPYVGKLACCGASYGGYSAYMLEGLHENLFDCFIAHAGIFDEKQLWFTTEEMWFANWDNGGLKEYEFTPGETGPRGDGVTFGGMQQAGAPYASTYKAMRHYASAPSNNVTKWHTPILCIHGMMDFRIPYEQGMAAFNAAQMMGVPSKLILFPEETHWVVQPQNALFWYRNYFEWLERWIKE